MFSHHRIAVFLLFGFILMFGCLEQPMAGCAYDNPPCEEDYGCINNTCVLISGCEVDNPPCDENHTCENNVCILKSGCQYDNPPCSEDYNCINNTCVLKEGCAYDNPPCGEHQDCVSNVCERLFDDEGRLTSYARSLAPPMLTLNLTELPKVHPEDYGNNYYEPGTYTVRVGDGFGKGDFLIKFVDFITPEEEQRGSGYIEIEVFKKERDGNYYFYPTYNVWNRISHSRYNQLFDLPIEYPGEYPYEIDDYENTLIYHPDCDVFTDYCYDESSDHYAHGDSEQCVWRCPFDATSEEVKVQSGKFTAVFPQGYRNLAEFFIEDLEQCHDATTEFLGYDPEKPRIGLIVYLGDETADLLGKDEVVNRQMSKHDLDDYVSNLDQFGQERLEAKCPGYLPLGYYLTHVLTTDIVSHRYGIREGLAGFVAFQNGDDRRPICLENGWKYHDTDTVNPYVSLNSNPSPTSFSFDQHRFTGFCFWQDFVETYGYANFVRVMQITYQKGRGMERYYLWDIFEEVNGEPLSEEIADRYSLTRDATIVGPCNKCDMFTE